MKKLFHVLFLFLISICLFACSSSKKIDVSGDWQLLRIESETDPLSEESMELMRSLGLNIVLTLKEDGTGILDMFSEVTDLTYDSGKMQITMEGEPVKMRVEDGLLILSEDSNTTILVFEKIPEE